MTAADRPTAPHPDLDTLADLDAGLLDAPTTGRLTAHVAGCARCTGATAALGAVRADLAALPTPRLPGPVAARLDATLAGLRHNDAHRSPDGAAAGGGPFAAGLEHASGTFHPQSAPTAPTAPTAPAVRGGPGIPREPGGPTARGAPVAPVAPRVPGVPGDASGSAAGPGADDESGPPGDASRPAADLDAARRRRRRRSLRITGGAVAAALALIAGGASVTAVVRNAGGYSTSGGSAGSAASLESESTVAAPNGRASTGASAADAAGGLPSYSRDTLRSSLSTIERESAVVLVSRLGEAGPAGVMADAARRQACEQSIIGREGVLRAVRRISYDGQPAYVFVFVFDDRGTRSAYVVGDQCGTGALSPVIDHVS